MRPAPSEAGSGTGLHGGRPGGLPARSGEPPGEPPSLHRGARVDLNDRVIEEARVHTPGLLSGSFESASLPVASFKVVVMWHVLEHMPRPDLALAKVAGLLDPGGVLLLEVPNVTSPIAWLLYRRRWLGFGTPDHLFAFSWSTLAPLVQRAGLELVRVSWPVIAGTFPGGWKGLVRQVLFGLLMKLDWGDGLRVVARKPRAAGSAG
ncbi:MAG: class I SAM-dependent methyltransferase [Candidatus Riflebacteria bacterium]|nr:class I SAM-dependent methyltransferase [Candidatus Riflebacteria bacterium]